MPELVGGNYETDSAREHTQKFNLNPLIVSTPTVSIWKLLCSSEVDPANWKNTSVNGLLVVIF